MNEYVPLAPCTYRDAVTLLSADEAAPDGFETVTLNSKGKAVSGLQSLLPGRKRTIAVNREFYRSISDATRRVREQIEPILFNTRETVAFSLDMRIGTSRERAVEIAQSHFHESKGPEQLFYAYFGNEFRQLLEKSALLQPQDIDARIAENKEEWERDLRDKLEKRFAIHVELNFLIEKEIAQDKMIASDPSAALYLAFSDRIDRKVPLRVDLRFRHLAGTKSNNALPRNEENLRNRLFGVIQQACERDLLLFDYWYRPERMRTVVTANLDAYLVDYAHQIANLVIVREEGSAVPPPQSVKLDTRVSWQDSRGYRLEFRAEAVARIDEDGAGHYDRAGRPDRAAWFENAIEDSLKHVLAGIAINDLGDNEIESYNELVKQRISAEAAAIGVRLEVFFGSVFLPLQEWLRIRRVKVPEASYATAHPKIAGNFTMDMEVRFETRRALEPFFVQYARVGGHANNNVPDDEFVNRKLVDAAREAAELVMQGTPADTYFSSYIGAAKWDASLPSLPDPGEGSGEDNRIFVKLQSILENTYPGVTLLRLHFHRLDRGLEKLRQLVGQLQAIEFECDIPDRLRGDAGLDRLIKGYITIEGGDAGHVVKMMDDELHNLEPLELKLRIARHLTIVVGNRLNFADAVEIESLRQSLTRVGSQFTTDLATGVFIQIKEALKADFGLIAGRIELSPELSEGETVLRETTQELNQQPLDTMRAEMRSLSRQLGLLLSQRESLSGTGLDENQQRLNLTEEIEKVKRNLEGLQNRSNTISAGSAADFVRHARTTYLNPRTQTMLTAPVAGPDADAAAGESASDPGKPAINGDDTDNGGDPGDADDDRGDM